MPYRTWIPVTLWLRSLLVAVCLPTVCNAQITITDEPVEVVDLDVTAAASGCSPYCCPDTWLYMRLDYLYWWTSGQYLPPLATTSEPGTAWENAGVLGEAGTEILFGNARTSSGPRSGFRWAAGIKLDDEGDWWLMADGLFLDSLSDSFFAGSDGDQILARPFFDTDIQAPNAELIAFPGTTEGWIDVGSASDLWGGGLGLKANLLCCQWEGTQSGYRVDFLFGYRFLQLSDDLVIREHVESTAAQGPLLIGTAFDITDEYYSRSTFHGLDLGLSGEWMRNRNFIAAEARVALGNSSHRLTVDGATTVTVPGHPSVTYPGGLLAVGGVLGEHTGDDFAVVPQAEIRLGAG